MKPSEIAKDNKISNRDKFGVYVKGRRKELGMTIRTFAGELNLTPAYISDFENGNRNAPLKYLEKVAHILLVEEDEINYFYDIAGASRSNWPDLNEYLAKTPNARKALRLARDKNMTGEQLLEAVSRLAKEKSYDFVK